MALENALMAGLFGALLSAAFSFWIRKFLDSRALAQAEKRLAYVHFVKFSEILAIEVCLKNFVKTFIPEDARKIFGKAGFYNAAHEICAKIAFDVSKNGAKAISENQGANALTILIDSQISSIKSTKLSDEQLSKLPKQMIDEYVIFQGLMSYVENVLQMWKDAASGGSLGWVNTEAIHDQWLLVLRISRSVQAIRASMLGEGVVTPEEARNLLKKQVDTMTNIFLEKHLHATQLGLAEKAMAQSDGEKPS